MIIRLSPTGGNYFCCRKSFDVNIAISGNFVLNAKNSNDSNRSIPVSTSCMPVSVSVCVTRCLSFLAFSCENRERKKLSSLKEKIKLEKLNSLIFRLFLKLDEFRTCNVLFFTWKNDERIFSQFHLWCKCKCRQYLFNILQYKLLLYNFEQQWSL